jgi:hypothetical protein
VPSASRPWTSHGMSTYTATFITSCSLGDPARRPSMAGSTSWALEAIQDDEAFVDDDEVAAHPGRPRDYGHMDFVVVPHLYALGRRTV